MAIKAQKLEIGVERHHLQTYADRTLSTGMLSGSATSQALCQCGQLIKMSGMYWGATQTTSESEGLKKRSSLMFFEVHILFFPCPDLYAPAFTLSSTYRLSLVTNSRLREENLSFPSVERTLGVLLL